MDLPTQVPCLSNVPGPARPLKAGGREVLSACKNLGAAARTKRSRHQPRFPTKIFCWGESRPVCKHPEVNAGYVEGRNLTIEYSPGGLQTDPISSRAAGLVSRPVSAIFAIGTVAAQAAKA